MTARRVWIALFLLLLIAPVAVNIATGLARHPVTVTATKGVSP